MQPDKVTEDKYRVITHPRPLAAIRDIEIRTYSVTAIG
jgi:hypothetical protein